MIRLRRSGSRLGGSRGAQAAVEHGQGAVQHAKAHPALQAAADRLPRRTGRLPLTPDPQRTVLRRFNLATAADGGGGDGRLHRILALLEQLDAGTLKAEVAATKERLGGRHRAFEATLRRNLESVASLVPGVRDLDEQHALLFGAFVTAEYSFEAAALFNPSVIPHPDQSNLEDGALRLAMGSWSAVSTGQLRSRAPGRGPS